jgi:hypothetical protein
MFSRLIDVEVQGQYFGDGQRGADLLNQDRRVAFSVGGPQQP